MKIKELFKDFDIEEIEFDFLKEYDHEDTAQAFLRFYIILKYLISERGCSWDIKQDKFSLVKSLTEETYELIDAIYSKDLENFKEELGDVFISPVMMSNIAEIGNESYLKEVFDQVSKKLISRHPHIFQRSSIEKDYDHNKEWDRIKIKEGKTKKTLDNEGLPPLLRACEFVKKATKKDFNYTLNDSIGDRLLALIREAQDKGLDINQLLIKSIKEKTKLFDKKD